jgi:DNA-directed RNA polymerase beta' subunit
MFLQSIQFGLVGKRKNFFLKVFFTHNKIDPDLIRRVGFRIESSDTWEQNTPVKNGLFDLRMGTIDRRFVCQTCGRKERTCPGHIGYFCL